MCSGWIPSKWNQSLRANRNSAEEVLLKKRNFGIARVFALFGRFCSVFAMGKKEKRKSEAADLDATLDTSHAEANGEKSSYETKVENCSKIAMPLATRKLAKKLYKLTKKAQDSKSLRKGVKEVQKFIRKGEKGIIVFAGDTDPIDVICHMPVVCEEKGIPYCYTPSKEDLGAACGSKRPTCMVMIKKNSAYEELYKELNQEVKGLPQPVN